MTKLWRLLMATTVLSGAAGVGTALAANNLVLPHQDQSAITLTVQRDAAPAPVVLAQAVVDDKDKNKNNKNNQQNTNQQNNKQNRDANKPGGDANKADNQNKNRNDNKNDNKNKPVTTQYSPPPPVGGTSTTTQTQTGGDKNKNRGQDNRNTDNKKNDKQNKPATTQFSPPPPPVGGTSTTTQTQTGGDKNKNKNVGGNDNANKNARDADKNKGDNKDDGKNNRRNAPAVTTTQTGGDTKQSTTTDTKNGTGASVIGTGNSPTTDQSKVIKSGGAGKGVTVQTNDGKTLTNVNDIKSTRQVSTQGDKTVIKEVDRTITKQGNKTIIQHDETARFRLGAVNVNIQKAGADNRTIIFRPDGRRIVTLTDRNGFLLRRSIILADGREIILINNRPRAGGYFIFLPPPRIRIPRERYIVMYRDAPPALLYDTLMAPPVDVIDRAYSLDEIRYSPTLRDRMPRVDIDTVTFESGSWELSPDQIEKLAPMADAMKRAIDQNPQTVFLVEGYTDAVGDENDNLSLSDRRAEAVAVALTEQFGVPAENLSTQGYGEQELKVPTQGPEQANRRVTVRNVAALLAGRGGPPQQN